MVAETIDDFDRAIHEKLPREIEYRPVISRLEVYPVDGIGWNLPARASLIPTRGGPPTVRPILVGQGMALWDKEWPCGIKIGMRGD